MLKYKMDEREKEKEDVVVIIYITNTFTDVVVKSVKTKKTESKGDYKKQF